MPNTLLYSPLWLSLKSAFGLWPSSCVLVFGCACFWMCVCVCVLHCNPRGWSWDVFFFTWLPFLLMTEAVCWREESHLTVWNVGERQLCHKSLPSAPSPLVFLCAPNDVNQPHQQLCHLILLTDLLNIIFSSLFDTFPPAWLEEVHQYRKARKKEADWLNIIAYLGHSFLTIVHHSCCSHLWQLQSHTTGSI